MWTGTGSDRKAPGRALVAIVAHVQYWEHEGIRPEAAEIIRNIFHHTAALDETNVLAETGEPWSTNE